MARGDGRVERGQKLATAFSARAWNRAQDAADIVLGQQSQFFGGPPDQLPPNANIILVGNSSGANVPWLGVLGIDGVSMDPSGGFLDGTDALAGRARQFARRPVLRGILPQSGSGFRIAIAMEPIPAGGIGKCAVGGVFACKVKRNSTSHIYAGALAGDVTQLQSVVCGPVRLLWTQSGTGNDKWAVGSM